jgi:hypothetical protein
MLIYWQHEIGQLLYLSRSFTLLFIIYRLLLLSLFRRQLWQDTHVYSGKVPQSSTPENHVTIKITGKVLDLLFRDLEIRNQFTW